MKYEVEVFVSDGLDVCGVKCDERPKNIAITDKLCWQLSSRGIDEWSR